MAYTTKKKLHDSTRDRGRSVDSHRRHEHDDRPPARIEGASWIVFFALLAFPAFAISRQIHAVDWRIIVGIPTVMSVLTFLAYRTDKSRARHGQWRMAESTLHMMELSGGWPGAFLAQRRYRHKTVKLSFQLTFWTIIAFHHLIAADSLLGWKFTSQLVAAISKGN
jgi:uncharacterized membrane protein YsdA (DUF1294 family)